MEFGLADLSALIQVILVDLLFAADNAIVVAMAAAGLPVADRKKAIIIGIGAAALLRILFSVITVQLLEIPWLLFAGGLLLVWVAWKLFTELKAGNMVMPEETVEEVPPEGQKTLLAATIQIIIADVSMSLDNVLAVAGIARHNLPILIFGLALSVVLMGVAASFIARIMGKYAWIGWVGLIFIVYIALKMMWEGYHDMAAEGMLPWIETAVSML